MDRSTGKEFALKIIDKAKCCGKVQYKKLRNLGEMFTAVKEFKWALTRP